MTYETMKKTTNWRPLVRHKRSQNTGVMYALVDEVAGVVDALMSISSRTEDEFGSVPPTGDQRNGRPPWDYSGRAMSFSDVRFRCPFQLHLVLAEACHSKSAYELDYARTTEVNLLDDGIDHGS